ncbi:MAG TPA: efflux RND transporter periplasmic adaptor subunit [Vicinamibacterales bacterium]|nr:efflux RND transporter periplasmic adaptor subunit [Vicinamibacterales bacterium]
MSDINSDLAALKIDPNLRQTGGRAGVWILAIVLLAAAVAGAAWWYTAEPVALVEAAPVEARVGAAAVPGAVLNASGYVTARRRATVSSKMTGKVVEVNVEEGMRVRAGQVLARLDDSQIRAAYELADAQVDAARKAVDEMEVRLREAQLTLGRRDQLNKEGVVGQADVDAAQAEVDSLRARIVAARQQEEVAARQLALQKTQLDDTVIRAPFTGVAISKDAQPGEMVSPVSAGGGFTRTGISTIVDMSSLEIEVDVSESYINRVTPAQKATAILDAYPDWRIPARVITTIPAADRQKATVLVRLAFESLDDRILPDMGVKVAFHGDAPPPSGAAAQSVTLVPKRAVRTDEGNSVVFVVNGEDRVERRAVKVGGEQGDRVEVLAGLKGGERVVLSPDAALQNGSKVRVRTKE